MKKLVFATGNPHKIAEVNRLLNGRYQILGLKDIGCTEELPETQPTIQGNALQKARFVYNKYGVDCFAEDTGLEIDALGGQPGVHTARFAGDAKDPDANMNKVLRLLEGRSDRSARFRTVIALILDGEEHLFEGIAEGTILSEKTGEQGFGYDPIFQPLGYDRSFAQMTPEEKNAISHRGKAVRKLIEFLG